MRIAVFLLHLQHGGVERALTDLANLLAEQGHDLDFYVTYKLGEPAYRLDSRVQVHYLTRRRPNREAFSRALDKRLPFALIKEASSALITLWQKRRSFRHALKRAAKRDQVLICTRHEQNRYLAGLKTEALKIGQLHFDVPPESKLFAEILERYVGLDALTVLNSQQETEFREAWEGQEQAPAVWSMPNFLPEDYFAGDLERFATDLPDCLAQLEGLRGISVGRLEPEKGFRRLLELWAAYLQELEPEARRRAKLQIVGDGSCRGALEERAQELEIAEQVEFCGFCSPEEIRRRMAQSDVYLMCSHTEGFGIVLLEAASQGLPLMAYDVRSGPRSIIDDGYSGFLIPEGKQDYFVQRLRQLSRQPRARQKMGQEARRQCQERFGARALGRRWAELLRWAP